MGGVPNETAWYMALIVIGLVAWILPWRRVQLSVTAPGAAGDVESRSPVRKIYQYFYLLVATLAMLGSGVYVVYQLISLLLGVSQPGNLLADLDQAIGYSLLAFSIWLYHGACLRGDARRIKGVQTERLSQLHVAVLKTGNKVLSCDLLDRLQRELPGLNLQALEAEAAETPAALGQADLIIGPWSVLATAPAPKVLLYSHQRGWYLACAGKPRPQESLRQAIRQVRQLAAGGEIKARQ